MMLPPPMTTPSWTPIRCTSTSSWPPGRSTRVRRPTRRRPRGIRPRASGSRGGMRSFRAQLESREAADHQVLAEPRDVLLHELLDGPLLGLVEVAHEDLLEEHGFAVELLQAAFRHLGGDLGRLALVGSLL